MPHIKKIDVRGFKSFGPKIHSVALGKGFTVLTGPNGSGKTNIVDAVLFGLGELSARRLRAENFAKLIFHGSPDSGVQKATAAKVVIQFDNSDGRIPVDTNTVTVSREVQRNGQSVYRLNGRRISRSRIVDMLSMAGINPTGHNVIVQGTITRMAEISSHECRKIIDDLVGIAQYDAEKSEAEEKLRTADISIRTAMGRIDEVQKRIDDLERERNELLCYTFIQKEIQRFEAMKISYEIREIERKIEDISSQTERVGDRVENLRGLREGLRTQRHEIEREWRKIGSEMVEEGGTRILEVQIKIGDIKSKLTELKTMVGAGTISLEGLKKVRDNNLQQRDTVKEKIVENRKKARRLRRLYKRLSNDIMTKHSQYDAASSETAQLWESLDKNSKKIRETEQRLDKLYHNYVTLRGEHARGKTTVNVISRRLKDLNVRRDSLLSTLNELKKSLLDLKEVQKEQKTRFTSLQRTLDRRIARKESIEKEIADAGKIAESAREAVVEFATQRELAEAITREESAIRNIEELGELGVIPGVYGRLRKVVSVKKGYRQTIEAAAAGWLDAIVVRDVDSAFTCTETLKRLKLGRIKIIPIHGLSTINSVSSPKINGVIGAASTLVESAKRYKSAVIFILGDTLVAKDDKAALKASHSGYRTVTVNGDLYEAGGGIESGYYRAPIDFSTIIPSETAVKSLDQAVKTLRDHLARRQSDMTTLDEEIDRTRVEIARLAEAITTLESEIGRVQRNIKRTNRNVMRVERHIQSIQERLEKEKVQIGLQEGHRNSLRKEMQKMRNELAGLRRKTDLSHIHDMEAQREKLGDVVVELQQRRGGVETELSTLQSELENVLRLGYNNAKIQLKKVEQQLSTVEREVEEALHQKVKLEEELVELERSKEELSRSVLTARKEAKKFTSQIDNIDKRMHRLDTEYERADRFFNQLQLKLQTANLQLDQHRYRLREVGYEDPLDVLPEHLETAGSSLELMRFELDRMGAVNQLALTHYVEQVSRYKELSIRMNELEGEKQAIISFMDEVERKKREVFMNAFNQINDNFSQYFSKLTGGGEAALKLEKPEEPFAGGMDMVVQFPGKPPILVSGASSGERSVSAVAFIFAIQDYMPASFYLFDEIDAHLDAFHVAKLGELLAEESEKSQFLVITLKPEMVSRAERVYGVFERNGVSQVVSTIFKEAV